MKKKEAIVIFTIVAIMVIILVAVIARREKINNENNQITENTVKEEFVEVKEDGTRVNTSNKLSETKKYDGLEISNITLTEKNNESYIRATVKNTTTQVKGDESITLTIIDKAGTTLTEVQGYLDTIQPGNTATLSIKASADFANAYDFKVSK